MAPNDVLRVLRSLATVLPVTPSLEFEPSNFEIEWTSSSICWADELPSTRLDPEQEYVIKCILRHRTALIVGMELDGDLAAIWDAAISTFPEWIGFLPDRMSLRDSVIADYRTQCEEMRSQMLGLFGGRA